ncbi:MAG TPA: phosphoribosylanthranilate isomerase [Anaerolineaceae bacterium]|jgi:phosphoribosylanthranilate isomerase|nr:phosphoribosylanthranilate isomerase [Anaerolineaceae bacterium]
MIIQIYAFTDVDTALKAAEFGVNHIGFVAGKYGEVPAELTFREAREIAAALPPQATAVALTMATEVDEILRMVEQVNPHIVHISSDLDDVDVETMRELRSRLDKNIRLMKAIPVEDETSVQVAQQYAAVSDLLLLDTKRSGFPGVGATGFTHDWNISKQIVETAGVPVILAGGLTPQNVAAAIATTHPWGVDSNTSTNVPGSNTDKDLQRIADFVKAVRSGENEA